MPRSGRPAKPTATKKAIGSYRKDRHGDQLEPPVATPDCPEWVRGDARTHWDSIVKMLAGMNIMAEIHAPALVLLVNALGRYVELEGKVQQKGYVTVTDNGNEVQSPYVGAMNKAWEQALKALREFGMTPAAMTTIRPPTPKAKEPDGKNRFFKPKLAS